MKYKDSKISIIEIHNRPEYVNILKKHFSDCKIILTFHNDPVNLRGSKTVNEREDLLRSCAKIIFISNWIKNRFFLDTTTNIRSNYEIIYHGVLKKKKLIYKKNKKIFYL